MPGESGATGMVVTIAAFAGGFLLGQAITWLIARLLTKRGDQKNAARLKTLESLEKHEPRFIAWVEQTSDIIGMSVH